MSIRITTTLIVGALLAAGLPAMAQADLDSGNQQGCAKHMKEAMKMTN